MTKKDTSKKMGRNSQQVRQQGISSKTKEVLKDMDITSTMDLAQEILDQTNQELDNMDPVNILVVGKTGVGKSTLINSLFREQLATTGVGKPVTQHLEKITKEGVPLALYDTRGLELDEDVQKQVIGEIDQLLKETKGTKDEVHVAYYCVNGNSNRLEEMEITFIEGLARQLPVIVVLTQSIGQPAQEFKAFIEDLDLPIADVIPVLARDYQINDEVTIQAFGLKTLTARTLDVIPEYSATAFNNVQQADIQKKAEAARKVARRYIASAFGVGFTPIPLSDAAVLVPMQITMIARITAIFGISLDKSSLLSILAGALGTTGATQLGRSISTGLMKLIPGVGTVAGGAISGGTAAAVTSALAMAYIEVLTFIALQEKGEQPLDTKRLREMMNKAFKDNLKRRKDRDADEIKEVEAIADEEMEALENQIEVYEDQASAQSSKDQGSKTSSTDENKAPRTGNKRGRVINFLQNILNNDK